MSYNCYLHTGQHLEYVGEIELKEDPTIDAVLYINGRDYLVYDVRVTSHNGYIYKSLILI